MIRLCNKLRRSIKSKENDEGFSADFTALATSRLVTMSRLLYLMSALVACDAMNDYKLERFLKGNTEGATYQDFLAARQVCIHTMIANVKSNTPRLTYRIAIKYLSN